MSSRTRLALALCVAFAGVGLWSSPAYAQSAISGVVKDETGAVMPGVSVEAASEALIEKVRTTITDENGAYRMIDLRPGNYTVTFTLQGFNVIIRELELPSNFVATINADLKVGTLQESVTVSGQSPLVDVQSNVKQQVLTRDVLDAVPTARTIQGLGQLVPGVTFDQPDVGGSRAMQQTYFFVRGTGSAQTVVMVDGLMTNGLMGDGAVNAYHNEAMTQEAVYMTSGGNAETMTAGVNLNLVPKDGGNRFTGGFKFAKSPSSWQGDNLTDELKSYNVRSVDRVSNFMEMNAEFGGPIMKDKLWFFTAYRRAYYDKFVPNTFDLPAGMSAPAGFASCLQTSADCAQGESPEKMDNPIGRLTWQISQKNKLARVLRPRPAPARRGDEQQHRPGDGFGGVEHPDLLHWVGQVDLDPVVAAPARGRRLLQHGTLRQPLPGRDPGRAQHPGVVPERPQGRPEHRLPVECVGRAAGQLPRPLHDVGGDVLRHRRAQREVRCAQRLGPVSPLQQR